MTTRVVGRGKCPRCGDPGSVVFKEFSGKVYVYIKHGRRWCYIGPLEAVDLSSMIIDLSDYHHFTTKIKESMKITGMRNMRVSILVFASVSLMLAAYTLSIASYEAIGYTRFYIEAISQVLVTMAVFTSLIAIALYEFKYKRRIELRVSGGVKGHILSILIVSAVILVSLIVFSPLSSTLALWISIKLQDTRNVVHYIVHGITLSCLMVVGLISLLISRSFSSRVREFIVKLLVSSVLASLAFYTMIIAYELMFSDNKLRMYISTYLDIIGHSLVLGLVITLLTAMYSAVISSLKRLISLDVS